AKLPPAPTQPEKPPRRHNFAVNNDGDYFPALRASYSNAATPLGQIQDGNYWYEASPPNRWTTAGSPHTSDWLELSFGIARPIDEVNLYFLEDRGQVIPPASFTLEHWNGSAWIEVAGQSRSPQQPTGHRANYIKFPRIETEKLRVVFTSQTNAA